ncbi:PIN domain-containing protein [Parabacteroides sp.]
MKRYLLDTNICIFYLQDKYGVVSQLEKAGRKNCCISEITVAELLYGVSCSNNKDKYLPEVYEFIDQFEIIPIYPSLLTFANSKATLRKQGMLIDDFDLLIGATAINNNLTLVSENLKHLSRIPLLKIENWIIR